MHWQAEHRSGTPVTATPGLLRYEANNGQLGRRYSNFSRQEHPEFDTSPDHDNTILQPRFKLSFDRTSALHTRRNIVCPVTTYRCPYLS
jgi:hypothetical protein